MVRLKDWEIHGYTSEIDYMMDLYRITKEEAIYAIEKNKKYEIEYNSLGDTIEECRKNLADIEFTDNQFTILNGQPGVGKSTAIQNYINNHTEIEALAIVSNRHNFLTQIKQKIHGMIQWYGITRPEAGCTQPNIEWFSKNFGFWANIICPAKCGSNPTCPFKEQFQNNTRVCCPTNYLNTKKLDQMNILFVEESIYGFNTHEYIEKDFCEGIEEFVKEHQYRLDAKEAIKNRNLDYFETVIFGDTTRLQYYETLKNNEIKWEIQNTLDLQRLTKLSKFKTKTIELCLKFNKDKYIEPLIYEVFRKAFAGVPVVLSHAGFIEDNFTDLLDRFLYEYPEYKSHPKLKIKIYTSNLTNKKSIVYHITNRSFSKSQMNKKDTKEIADKIFKTLREIHGRDGFAYISYKKDVMPLIDKEEYKNASWFHNTSGMNDFEGKPLLNVGTPFIKHDDKVDMATGLFGKNISETRKSSLKEDIKEQVINKRQHPNYENTCLDGTADIDEQESYDIIHRNRPLLHDVETYLCGRLPPKIDKELTVIEVPLKELPKFLDKLVNDAEIKHKSGDDMVRIRNIANDIQKGMTNTQVAKNQKMRTKDKKWDTQTVDAIRRLLV